MSVFTRPLPLFSGLLLLASFGVIGLSDAQGQPYDVAEYGDDNVADDNADDNGSAGAGDEFRNAVNMITADGQAVRFLAGGGGIELDSANASIDPPDFDFILDARLQSVNFASSDDANQRAFLFNEGDGAIDVTIWTGVGPIFTITDLTGIDLDGGTLNVGDATNVGSLTLFDTPFTPSVPNISGVIEDTTNVNVGAGSTFQLRLSETIGNLSGSGEVRSGVSPVTLGLNQTAGTTFSGQFNDFGAALGVSKSGAGTLTLSLSSSSYTGGLTLGAGGITLTNSSSLGGASNVVTFTGNSNLTLGNTVTVANNITINDTFDGTVTVATNEQATIASVISDPGNGGELVKAGAGTLVLSGANSFDGGLNMSAGQVNAQDDNALGSNANTVTFTANSAIQVGAGRTLQQAMVINNNVDATFDVATNEVGTLTGTISDATNTGEILKTGAGTLVLTGNNTFDGGVQLNAGALAVSGSDTALGSGTLTINGVNSVLQINDTRTLANRVNLTEDALISVASGSGGTFTSTIESAADDSLIKTSAGTLTLTGANANLLGGVELRGGVLAVQTSNNALGTGTLSFTTAAGNTLHFVDGRTLGNAVSLGVDGDVSVATGITGTLGGVINGAGGLDKEGAGILVLSGTNSYGGVTNVNGGTLRVGAATNALPNGTAVTIGAASTLDLNGNSELVLSVASTATDAVLALGAGSLTVGGADSSFAGQATGGGGIIKAMGTTTLTLTGNSSYSGGTVLQGGAISVGTNDTALGSGTVTFNTADNNVLNFLDDRTFTNNVVINQDAQINVGGTTNGTLNGVISTTSTNDSLIKTGTGTLNLGGNNSYTGGTEIRGGTLVVRNSNNALGTGALSFTTVAGNTLAFGDNGRNFSSTITLNASANFDVGGTNSGTLSGPISGAAANSLTKTGTGTLVLSGSNTYNGDTLVNGGVLRLGTTETLDDDTDIVVGTGATFSLNTFNDTVSSIASSAANAVVDFGTGTLTVGTNGTTFAGILQDSGATDGASLIKIAATTLTLTGASTFAGGIDLRGGAIAVGTSNTALGAGTLTFSTADGNRLLFNDSGRVLANNVLLGRDASFEVTAGTATLSGVISGTAGNDLTKIGAGTLILSGASTYVGATLVNVGVLQLGANNALADDTDVTIASGATLALNTFSDTVRTLTSTATDATVNFGTGVLTVGAPVNSTFNGVLADSGALNDGALVKLGAGTTLTLTGNSTYAGGTDLRNGAISVSTNNTALGTGALTFSTNSGNTLNFVDARSLANGVVLNEDGIVNTGTNIAASIGGAITGTAANGLIKTGAGTLTLGGATNSTYAGGTELRAGVLAVQTNSTALGTGTLTFSTADNSTLLFSSSGLNLTNAVALQQDAIINTGTNAATLSGILSGDDTDALTKQGAGTLTLSGVNTFQGGVNLAGGAVAVQTSDSALGTGTLAYTGAGTTLQFVETGRNIGNAIALNQDGNVDTQAFNDTLSSVITGGAANSLTKLGTGTLTLTGANTAFAGGLTIGNGAVSIANANNIGTGTFTFNDAGNDARLQLTAAMTLSNAIAVTQGGTFDTGGLNQTLAGAFVAGAGTLTRTGAGTVTLTGNGTAFNGTFVASEATTTLNGAVLGSGGAGNLDVLAMATLTGTGTIGGNLSNAGFLRPGFSPGTMTVQGDFTQSAAGTYDAEINADGTSDLIDATGNANLDGALNLIGQADQQGTYFGKIFTIVEADGTINGGFASVVDNLQLLTPTVTVDNSGAISRVQISFNTFAVDLPGLAANPNQAEVARALQTSFTNGEAGADLRSVFNQFLQLSPAAMQQVFQQLAGEFRTASMTTALNNNSLANTRLAGQMGSLRNIFGRRARSAALPGSAAPRTARLGFGQSVTGFGLDGTRPGAASGITTYEDWEEELPEDQVWVLGTGQWGDIDPTAVNQGFDYDGQGFLLGHTWEVSDNVLVGAHVGYNSNEVNVVGGLDKTDIESFNLGAHATYYHDGDYLDGVIGITNDEFDTQRFIQFGTIDRVASGDFDADQHYLYLEAGRTYELGDEGEEEQLHVQPQLALQYRNYTQDAYSETGADDLNLTTLENDLDMFQTALGARFFYTGRTDDGSTIVPDLMVRWAHEHGDVDRTVRSQFVGTSTVFATNGIKQDRDSVQVRAGITAATMDDLTVDVSYNGELASHQKNHAGVLRLIWRY